MTMNHDEEFELFELPQGGKISWAKLRELLPDIETALLFGKAYKLDAEQLGQLLVRLFDTPLLRALTEGTHSTELQDYLVDLVPEDHLQVGVQYVQPEEPLESELLFQLWESAQIELAQSIADVASKLSSVLSSMPGREGALAFKTLAKLSRRGTVGTFEAYVQHRAAPRPNLVVLDVSGSMTEATIRTIVQDVVALAWRADAWLAIVSNTATAWEPGTATVEGVLEAAEYSGTRYEELLPLFHRDWGVVTAIADYDSSYAVKRLFKDKAQGSIDTVLDLSLVNRPTFLGEVLSTRAREVKTLMVASERDTIIKDQWYSW